MSKYCFRCNKRLFRNYLRNGEYYFCYECIDKDKQKWFLPYIEHGKLTKWNWCVYHPKHLELGNNVDIGMFTFINAKCGVIIEDNVQIGGGCKIYSENTINNMKGQIIIRKNAKIGANSVILPGVEIKENTLIPALSVVYQDKEGVIRVK